MNAIANCKEAIQGKLFNSSDRDVQDLKQLLHQAEAQITAINTTTTPLPRVQNTDQHTVPRVQDTETPSPATRNHTAEIFHSAITQRVTRSATTKTKARRQQQPPPPVYLPNQPPALSTQSKVRQAHTTTPRSRCHSSRLRQPTKSSLQRNRQQALSAQLQHPKGRTTFIQQYKLLEKEVEKAMMVLDEESGRMLKYKDLLRHPKYKKQWSIISAADEFGRLAQGVGGRIKKPTDTIRFIREQDVPKDRRKDVTYGSFTCTVRPEKADPNRTRFTAVGDKINYPGEVATPAADMLVAKIILFNRSYQHQVPNS
jgi:hypothetical protein